MTAVVGNRHESDASQMSVEGRGGGGWQIYAAFTQVFAIYRRLIRARLAVGCFSYVKLQLLLSLLLLLVLIAYHSVGCTAATVNNLAMTQ